MLVAARVITPYESPGANLGQLQWLAGTAAIFLGGPLVLLSSLSDSASPAAAEAPTARRAAAAAEPGPLPVPVWLDAADEGDPVTGPLDARRAATDKPRGSRPAERKTGTTPRSSAAVTGTIPRASAAVSTRSSTDTAAAEASNPKSRVTSRSRR